MATRKNVPASVVRTWAAEQGIEVGSRGRLHPDVVKAFHKANKSKRYEPKVAEAPTVTVKVKTKDKNGRNRSKDVTVTTAEARKILGHEKGKRGRFSKAALAEALSN